MYGCQIIFLMLSKLANETEMYLPYPMRSTTLHHMITNLQTEIFRTPARLSLQSQRSITLLFLSIVMPTAWTVSSYGKNKNNSDQDQVQRRASPTTRLSIHPNIFPHL